MVMRIQPQGLTRIDQRNPIGADLVLSIHAGTGVREIATSRPMTGRGSAQSIKGFDGGQAFDLRGTNTGSFINMAGSIGQLCGDHTLIVDVVLSGAQSGATSPSIAGLWRSTSQHDSALVIERTGAGSISVTAKVGAAAASVARAFDIGAANLYGKRLILAASITRGASGRRVYLRVACEGVLLYSFDDLYVLEANADLVPTGTEYISIGSEQVENSTRNPNCIVYSQQHLARLVTPDEVLALSINPWQVYDDPGVEEELAPAEAPAMASDLAGAAVSQSSASGVLSTAVRLTGAVVSQATVSGALAASAAALAGSAVSQVSAGAVLSTQVRLAGGAVSQAGASGALSTGIDLAGSAVAQSSASGSLATPGAALTGAAASQSSASGALFTTIRLAGAARCAASASGALAGVAASLAGAAVVRTFADGLLTTSIKLSGVAAARSTGTGSLSFVQGMHENVDISKISPARIVVFEGSGSRVVPFASSGSRVTPFEGSGSRVVVFEGSGNKTVRFE